MKPEATEPTIRAASSPGVARPPWYADLGDGTYRNPVLFADYSDPDAIRVGEDFWLTASSFNHVPGLPVLHSRDLVNWTLVNHALPRLQPADHFSRPRHGQGVWAPAIRHHGGRTWIFYPDPDFGIHVVTTEDPRGAWSEPRLLLGGRGLIDPCPLWDDDGSAWLVHAWARSRSGVNNRITLHRMASDVSAVLDAGEVIIDGDALPGWHTIEGPKLYKRAGYYYIFAPAGGVATGYQAVFRARDIRGPWTERVVLAQGASAVNGPHQGAWVDTPEGDAWFLHFQELPAYGRVVHLQPMRWSDGWPVMGAGHVDDGPGEPVATWRHPRPGVAPVAVPATSDEFDGPHLGRQWQWQANPDPSWASLTAAPGRLRLRAVRHEGAATLWEAPNLLLQKFPAPAFEVVTCLHAGGLARGDAAGLIVFGYSYAWIGYIRDGAGLRLVLQRCDDAHEGGVEREVACATGAADVAWVRVVVEPGARCCFSWSADGVAYEAIGEAFAARSSKWVGAKVGLFARSAAVGEGGHADFPCFRVSAPGE